MTEPLNRGQGPGQIFENLGPHGLQPGPLGSPRVSTRGHAAALELDLNAVVAKQ